MITEVAYVCSADFEPLLFLSMRSLFSSGTTFDRVVVYLVDTDAPNWRFRDDRIHVEVVSDISDTGWGKNGKYWGTNKTHFCQSDADRLIYLDVDTLVLRPIDAIYESSDADLLARLGVRTYTHRWDPVWWQSALNSAGSGSFPLYSPGFMVMQNASHRRIKKTWRDCIKSILQGEVPPLGPDKHAELYAYSLACGVEGLTHQDMLPEHHRYAMIGEDFDDAVVYHLGTPGFYRHYFRVEDKLGKKKLASPAIHRPRFLRFRGFRHRLKHRIKTRLYGAREKRGEY